MIKISCYKTKQDQLAKAFCQLAQKCYYSSTNTCVITNNSNFTIELDRVLWTYSKKHFIPHATKEDPFPQEQPIYITHSIENPNNSKIIILVNPTEDKLLQLFSSSFPIPHSIPHSKFPNYTRNRYKNIFIIYLALLINTYINLLFVLYVHFDLYIQAYLNI